MMRDPAVLALCALHLTLVELVDARNRGYIRRPVWPPKTCEGAVVGLCAAGLVFGEARLTRVVAGSEPGEVVWHFGVVILYAHPLPHPFALTSRAMASLMPPAPLGTLTPARQSRDEW